MVTHEELANFGPSRPKVKQGMSDSEMTQNSRSGEVRNAQK